MATFVHFDVPTEDIERAKKFYETIFNWEIKPVPGPMEYYDIITKDEKGDLGLVGGMGKRGAPDQKITNYIGVDSVDEFVEKVIANGGRIIMPKTTIPGFGYLATFLDTEGNVMGLWETDPNAQME
jgi:predicted enzyme related to lactoylglutathione lyase